VAKVYGRTMTVAALTLAALMIGASSAAASEASFDPPVPGAELVSRETVSGAENVKAMLGAVQSVDMDPGKAVITVDDAKGPHDITLDYGDLLSDKRTAGAGYFAGAYVGLGVLSRLARMLRSVWGPLGR